jgi:hypothetical protein
LKPPESLYVASIGSVPTATDFIVGWSG